MTSMARSLSHDAGSVPLRTGIALSLTFTVFYALCTLVRIVAPGPFMSFMNMLFHGMDFTLLVKPGTFSLFDFIGASLVLATWSFLAGTFYGWLRQRLGAFEG